MRPSWIAGFVFFSLGCGVQQVELSPTHGEVIVLDALPPGALARLQRVAKEEKPEPMLTLSYPPDQSAIPENLAPITFLFGDDKKPMEMMMKGTNAPFRAFELRLTGTVSDLRVYTSEPRATLPFARWQKLLSQEQHAELTLVVRAVTDKDRVVASHPVTLRVRGATAPGRIRYWNDALASAMGATLDAQLSEAVTPSDYPTLEPWQSRSADGSHLALAQDGALRASVGAVALAVEWANTLRIDYPSWSPDGSALAFVIAPAMMAPAMPMMMMMSEPGMAKSSLLQARMNGDANLSEPELLLSADMSDELLRAPSYSPDGRFIAFERAKGKDKVPSLWLMPSAGGQAKPVASKLAWKGEGELPTWLPALDDDAYWLVFSQSQAPGVGKLPAESVQLWAVALELGEPAMLAPQAVAEPFWLPFQSSGDSNRRALFVEP